MAPISSDPKRLPTNLSQTYSGMPTWPNRCGTESQFCLVLATMSTCVNDAVSQAITNLETPSKTTPVALI
jgi:hypothetical protein